MKPLKKQKAPEVPRSLPELCRYIRPTELQKLLGYRSRQALWKARRRGDLPPAVKIGANAIGWREDVLRAWLDSRPAA